MTIERVWVVIGGSPNSLHVVGVFSSPKAAAVCKEHYERWNPYRVEERVVEEHFIRFGYDY